MSIFGITGFGAYAPRLRLDRRAIADAHAWMAPALAGVARGARSFCSWDEDAITMAVEAGRDALASGGKRPQKLLFASTCAPYADLQSAPIVAGALSLGEDVTCVDVCNNHRSGVSALLQGLAVGAPAIVIASDAPRAKPASPQEMTYGAGAVAIILGTDNVKARLAGSASTVSGFVDHFRAGGASFDYFWEERWIRDEGYLKLAPAAIRKALDAAKLSIDDIDHFVMPSLIRKGAAGVARAIGFRGELADDLHANCGHAGAAHAPLMLCNVLERARAGERILLAAFGQGCDALVFEMTEAAGAGRPPRGVAGALARGRATDSYLRMLSFGDLIDLDWGMRAEKDVKTALSEQHRSSFQLSAFAAGKCPACGAVQFPQLEYCVNPKCAAPAAAFEQISLVDEKAQIMTCTADWLSYYPAPPLHVGFVQFDNGARVQMEIVDVGNESVDVGDPVSMVFRIKERDRRRGYNRYFWKATPEDGRSGA